MAVNEDWNLNTALDELFSSDDGGPDVDESTSEPDPEGIEAKSDPEGDEGTEKVPETDDGDEDPNDVPYARVAQLSKQKRELKSKVEELEAKLAEASQVESTTETENADDALRDILKELGEDSTTGKVALALQAKIDQLTAQTLIATEIDEASKAYPDYDRAFFEARIKDYGFELSAKEATERYLADQEESEAATLAKFFEKNPDMKAAYLARQKSDGDKADGTTVAPEAAPSIKGRPNKPKSKPSAKDQSGSDYMASLMDHFGV